MSSKYQRSDTPRQVVEMAAACGIAAVEQVLVSADAKVEHIFILIHASNTPASEDDCTASGQGYEDGREMLAELLGHAPSVAEKMGLDMKIVPVLGGKTGQG